MATFSASQANYGLKASALSNKTNVVSVATIGASDGKKDFATADIAYSFSVTSAGATDAITLTLADGAVAQTTGSPVISDAGTDFEGGALPTMNKINAVYAVYDDVVTGEIDITGLFVDKGNEDGQVVLKSYPVGNTTLTDIVATFDTAAQKITFTIVGETA